MLKYNFLLFINEFKLKNSSGNLVGTLFDKALTIIVSLVLINKVSPVDYVKWGLMMTYIVLVNTILFSKVHLDFYKDRNRPIPHNWLHIYNTKWILFGIIVIGILNFNINKTFLEYIIEFFVFITYPLYEYFSVSIRYRNLSMEYAKNAVFKFLIFGFIVSFEWYFDLLNYLNILFAFFISIVFILSTGIKRISFQKFSRLNYSDIWPTFTIAAYGLTSGIIGGFEKILGANLGYSPQSMSTIILISTYASIPSLFVEAAKKTITPLKFKLLAKEIHIAQEKNYFIKIFLILLALQLTFPLFIFYFADKINFYSEELFTTRNYSLIFIYSCGLCFYVYYHFFNPYYFFNDKVYILLFIQISLIILTALWGFFMFDNSSVLGIIILKALLLFFIVLISFKIYYDETKQYI